MTRARSRATGSLDPGGGTTGPEGAAEALRRGTGKSARKLKLEREVRDLREALTDTTVKLTLVQRAMGIDGARPTRPEAARVVRLPRRSRHASAEAVQAAIRDVRKVRVTLRREGLVVSRRRIWALMHARGLVRPFSAAGTGRRRQPTRRGWCRRRKG